MPVPAPPMYSRCPDCGWETVTPQRSDVLHLPRRCPACGSTRLEHHPAQGRRLLRDVLKGLLGGLRS